MLQYLLQAGYTPDARGQRWSRAPKTGSRPSDRWLKNSGEGCWAAGLRLANKGTSAKLLHDRVKNIESVDPYRIRFVLNAPWPDFLVFYATPATGAAWVVPKKYIEKVGEDGFKRQPIGLGPYRFGRVTPGVELVLEANEPYWRKKPSTRRVVIKGVPDRSTRLAMLKTGEADIAYLMIGVEAATVKADPRLRLAEVISSAAWWLEFTEQWDPKSRWYDRRVRLAANMAIDRQAINEAERLGLSV
jgi:peptide/nickel transport system substrate-binding protein